MIEFIEVETQAHVWVAPAHVVAVDYPDSGENPTPATAAKIVLAGVDHVVVFGDPFEVVTLLFPQMFERVDVTPSGGYIGIGVPLADSGNLDD